jgi:hypothetical protein
MNNLGKSFANANVTQATSLATIQFPRGIGKAKHDAKMRSAP